MELSLAWFFAVHFQFRTMWYVTVECYAIENIDKKPKHVLCIFFKKKWAIFGTSNLEIEKPVGVEFCCLTTFTVMIIIVIGQKKWGRSLHNLGQPQTIAELDSQKTKLLETKTVHFSINNKQFPSNYFKKSQNNNIIFIENSKK